MVFVIFSSMMLIPVFLITNLGAWPVPLVLVITSVFFITVNGRVVPAMAIISSTTEPKTRGSFMSFNSSVQQLSAGIAAFLAGSIVGKDDAGRLLNYNYVGYIALLAGVVVIYAATRIKSTETSAPPVQVSEEVKVN
jgi:predicted MFS family arabinose efflux permease